jgi:triosephosphate isomerase
MPRPLIAGNWKMNGLRADGLALVGTLADELRSSPPTCEALVCPPAPLLFPVREALGASPVALGAQDCHPRPKGACTGDVAAAMLADAGCSYVIVGHSERRAGHGEDDALVREKAAAVQQAGMCAIICIGESLAERDAGEAASVVSAQLNGSLPDGAAANNTVIAYEPVWAIGTGRTPEAADIIEIHARIRADLGAGGFEAAGFRILYGGSVKPENAEEILALADVNGALVGGASLNADDFLAICRSCP